MARGLVSMAGVPVWAWILVSSLLAGGISAVVEILQTRMKLAFAREVLRPGADRDDPDGARRDLDAARKFITPPQRRQRPRSRPFRSSDTTMRDLPAKDGLGSASRSI